MPTTLERSQKALLVCGPRCRSAAAAVDVPPLSALNTEARLKGGRQLRPYPAHTFAKHTRMPRTVFNIVPYAVMSWCSGARDVLSLFGWRLHSARVQRGKGNGGDIVHEHASLGKLAVASCVRLCIRIKDPEYALIG